MSIRPIRKSKVTQVKLGALSKVQRRFKNNLKRIESLLLIFDRFEDDLEELYTYPDILRAAVVLLHATTEDALRGLLAWKLPDAPESCFNEVHFDESKALKQIKPFELTKHRGKTVDKWLEEVVRQYCQRKSFSNPGQINQALKAFGFKGPKLAELQARAQSLAPAMERRHKIVHESDRLDGDDTDHGKPRSISRTQVADWVDAAQDFFSLLFKRLVK